MRAGRAYEIPMARSEREILVQGHQIKVRGRGFGNKITVLEPVKGTIEVCRSGGEFLSADWFPAEPGAKLPVREDEVIFALETLDG